MSDENTVERIKKLLRLAQSSNPYEAALAMARAFEVAVRYKIEIADLDLEDPEAEELLHRSFPIGLRISFLKRKALGLVISFFNVNGVCQGDRVTLIGTDADVTIAWYVFEVIVGEAKRRLRGFECAERACARRSTKKKRDSFMRSAAPGRALAVGEARRRPQPASLREGRCGRGLI